ncbi:MAG: CCA tRNA nucleotidyltransferase, partial [Candidatus Binatia bacterium]|nr:CCA tRNA nucleotidyltransferase [Candidatus Binatia bacterium]
MPQREMALYIIERLRRSGFEAYLAGGCVRDKLLGKEPKDYDIATNARPEAVQRIFPRTVPVGSQFGVVMVMLEGESLEVATFRFDGPYLDGRHPSQVRFGSMEEDIMRRDFTINGMMYDPTRDRVIDLVEGAKDIKRRVIRAIGDARRRFEEDHLRMLRAVRIAAGLDFTIDENTLQAIQEQAAMITRIAWERIGEEITRLLTEGSARKGFDLLDATGLLPVLLPEVEATKGVEQSSDFHPEGDVYVHTLATLEYLKDPTETLAYGCLLHDIAKPACFKREGERIS